MVHLNGLATCMLDASLEFINSSAKQTASAGTTGENIQSMRGGFNDVTTEID